MIIAHYEFPFVWISVVTLFYMKIHNESFYFLGVALNYTIHHLNIFLFNFLKSRSHLRIAMKIT